MILTILRPIKTESYDCFYVKNWLGHEKMATTEGYIKHAENYYRDFPVDWISCALKSDQKLTGMHKNNKGKKSTECNFEVC